MAVAVKVLERLPAATVTDGGTTRFALLSDRATVAPPAGAAWVRVTVQVLEPGVAIEVGEQPRAETPTGVGWTIETVPPVAVAGIEVPAPEDATGFETWTAADVDAVEAAMVKVARATTPLAMPDVFRPKTRQFRVPEPASEQLRILPAFEADAPATTLTELKSAAG
ncbi:MAG: hypothetical protein IPM24_22120 [Bryobacterales bacterium]|nr:hypothetical protein [Bryobacterales bacterium]